MDNHYQDRIEEYISNMSDLMVTFEVTKYSGYSTFMSIYREKTLINLYEQVIDHFQILEVKELFFYAPSGERIRIPISKQTVTSFIETNIKENSVNLVPIYTHPRPVIYRLYLDDGNCYNNDNNISLLV